jgi:hypothetical protein
MMVEKGTYSFELNGHYISTQSTNTKKSQHQFPCHFLLNEKNSLRIKNIFNRGGSRIENLKTFLIKINDIVLTPKDSRLRFNSQIKFNF